MSAFKALDAARAARIEVRLDGKDLALSGASEPPANVLKMLRRHKRSIVALLERPIEGPPQPWNRADWRAFYDEQVAIAEHYGELPRAEAESRAFRACIAEWLWRTAVVSPPGPCPVCGDADQPNGPLLAIGIIGGRTWLHKGCVKAWCAGRKAEAVAALSAMNIVADPLRVLVGACGEERARSWSSTEAYRAKQQNGSPGRELVDGKRTLLED
jgi:hypothetical protein